MPSGITHDRITFWLLPWIVVVTYCLTRNLPRNGEITLILSGSYLFSGMMFGPDLDIHSIQYKRWGFIRGIWLPYRRVMRHRSLLSHGLIIGTCVRLIYLGSVIILVGMLGVAIAQLIWGFSWNWQHFIGTKYNLLLQRYSDETIALLIGLEIGAMSHSISDWVSSHRKVRLRKKLSQPKKVSKKLRKAKIYQKKD